jgi:iron uptake system component EfeO
VADFACSETLVANRRRATCADRPARIAGRVLVCLAAALGLVVVCGSAADAAPLDEAAAQFKPCLVEWIAQSSAEAAKLRDRIAAQDLAGAQQAWLAGRGGWEAAEVATSELFPDLDRAIDAWPDAEAGFHAIEAKLFGAHRVDALPEAETLVTNLREFDLRLRDAAITPQLLLDGVTKLAFEIGESKADGGESQFSGNSLAEVGYNVAGITAAWERVFAPAVEASDAERAATLRGTLDRLHAIVAVPVLASLDADALRTLSEELAATLRKAAPEIGLAPPTLEN